MTLCADQTALARLGTAVRERLGGDPLVYRIPVDTAELYAVGDFLSADECADMMARIDAVARPSSIYDGDHDADFRTSYSGNTDPSDPFIRMVERRMDDLLGIEPAWGENVQGQRYQVGQQFKAHHDWFHETGSYWPTEQARGGQRSWTAMVFLNDVEEGGTTEFPELHLAVPPQAGALLAWNNARPDGSPNPMTLHAALPVTRGVKYVITKWYRTRRWG